MGKSMSQLVTLMYHSIYENENDLLRIDNEDRPYAVSRKNFCEQLDLLKSANIRVLEPDLFFDKNAENNREKTVLLTFDDGHSSFYTIAYPELKKRNLSAIFFVTSDFIGKRDNFCTWPELREMHEAGMSIQSHGKTHKFISDLHLEEASREIIISKQEIEKQTGNRVVSLSFPGGRYTSRDVDLCKMNNYKYVFTSDIGTGIDIRECSLVPRLVIKKSTGKNKFLILAKGSFLGILKLKTLHFIKAFIKRTIGNRLYHDLYRKLASRK